MKPKINHLIQYYFKRVADVLYTMDIHYFLQCRFHLILYFNDASFESVGNNDYSIQNRLDSKSGVHLPEVLKEYSAWLISLTRRQAPNF